MPQVASIEYRLPSKVPEKISLDYTTLTAYADKLLALIGYCGLEIGSLWIWFVLSDGRKVERKTLSAQGKITQHRLIR